MLVIIDYGVGNLMSIQNMINRIGHKAKISGEKSDIVKATKLIFPGMGHFDNCMDRLMLSDLLPAIQDKVLKEKTPILGICVGLQMLMEDSEEGVKPGLKWIKGHTKKINPTNQTLKVPHMGWQSLSVEKSTPLLSDLESARFYFAHSYHVECKDSHDTVASIDYGSEFTVAVERENIMGVQFHPEKSHRYGMQLFKNYIEKY